MSRWLYSTSPASRRSTGSSTSRSSLTAARSSSTSQPSPWRWSSSWRRASRASSSSSPSRSPSASQSMRAGTLQGGELVGQQVHQQPVVPLPVRSALVVAHHPHRLEPDGGIRADRAVVRGGGIDGEAVVPALVDEVRDGQPQRLGAQPFALVDGAQRDVEGGVAVLRIGLLVPLEQAGHLPLHLDREDDLLIVREQLLPHPRLIPAPPPAGDLRLGEDRGERRDVAVLERPQQKALAAEDRGLRTGHGGQSYERRPPSSRVDEEAFGALGPQGTLRLKTD